MRKSDLAVIGIGLATAAVALAVAPTKAETPAFAEPLQLELISTDRSAEQQAQYDSWPPDRQVAFDSWGADTQAYYWSLSPSRQEFFWQLSDEDRAAMLTMEPVEREEAWAMIEGRMAEPPAE